MRSRNAAVVLVATLILGLVTVDARAADPEKPTLLGFATGDFRNDIPDFTAEAGRPPAIYQLYWSLDDISWAGQNNAWAQGMLSEFVALGMTPYVEITANDLQGLSSGDYDADLAALASTVADWLDQNGSRQILIAPLPEMNNVGHSWAGDPGGYKLGYARIRQAFLDRGLTPGQIRFVFAPNGLGDRGYDEYYPGDSTVDLVGFAKINRGDPWRDYSETFQMHIDEMRATVTNTKPILVTQTGSVTQNGNRGTWLEAMFDGLKTHDQVIGAVYFNRDKGGPNDYRVLQNGNLDSAFSSGYQGWSHPSEASWIFDGRMDAWVSNRAQLPPPGFADTIGHLFEKGIEWMADQGITQGCNPPANTKFCPDEPVTRGDMAIFLSRAMNYTDDGGGNLFTDDNGTYYEKAIDKLATAGVTQGCNPPANTRFCPDKPVTRGDMAIFLSRAMNYTDDGGGNLFTDDNGTYYERAIDKLATAGVTQGCNPPANTKFCPRGIVTRGQMATFLARALAP